MKPFTIIPAVDIKGGRCVRLRQGLADEETVYHADPVEAARSWQDAGADFLHVVDLDGAFAGRPVHRELVARIAQALTIPVEIGGGIRTHEHIREYLDAGVQRVILGTRACVEPEAVQDLAEAFAAGLAVGIDARNGRVQVSGWTETTGIDALDLGRRMAALGVKTLIYTDTARDGMLQGVNARAMAALCDAVECTVVASGGVTSVADITALTALKRPNLEGVIVGKALYEGTVTLPELLAAAAGRPSQEQVHGA